MGTSCSVVSRCPVTETLNAAGVRVVVRYQSKDYQLGESLGKVSPGNDLVLTVEVNDRRQYKPVVAFGQRTQEGIPSVEVLEPYRVGNECEAYDLVVPVVGQYHKGRVEWPKNRLYVFVDGPGGEVTLLNVGVVVQDHHFYVWGEIAFSGKILKTADGELEVLSNDGRTFTPYSKLIEALQARFERRVLLEATGSEVRDWPVPKGVHDLLSGEGEVVFWNSFQNSGWAWINTANGVETAKIHYSSLSATEKGGVRYLLSGQRISGQLEVGKDLRGPNAGQERLELKKVMVV